MYVIKVKKQIIMNVNVQIIILLERSISFIGGKYIFCIALFYTKIYLLPRRGGGGEYNDVISSALESHEYIIHRKVCGRSKIRCFVLVLRPSEFRIMVVEMCLWSALKPKRLDC